MSDLPIGDRELRIWATHSTRPDLRSMAAELLERRRTDAQYTAAPYEQFAAQRMWGVFPIGDTVAPPLALFTEESAADVYLLDLRDHVVLAVDGTTGFAWNDIDPPPTEPNR